MAPRAPATASKAAAPQRQQHQEPHDGGTNGNRADAGSGQTLTLFHKVRLSAGLLSNEAMAVFSGLYIMPLLQTLGTPIAVVTLPGVISASLGLTLVPLLGCLTDGGSEPHRRKRPVVVVAILIAMVGLSLNLCGTVLHAQEHTVPASGKNVHHNSSVVIEPKPWEKVGVNSFQETTQSDSSQAMKGIWDKPQQPQQKGPPGESLNWTTLSVWGAATTYTGASGVDVNSTRNLTVPYAWNSPFSDGQLQTPTTDVGITGLDISAEKDAATSSAISSPETESSYSDPELSTTTPFYEADRSAGPTRTASPSRSEDTSQATFLGLRSPALLGMAGFVLMDLAFDVTNSAVKTFMLTHSDPVDHVSLLVTGVFMSALGGVLSSLTSLVDLSVLLPDVDPLCSQAIVQLATLIVVLIACNACTLLSAQTPQAPPPAIALNTEGDEESSVNGDGGDMGAATLTLQTEVQESMIMARTSAVDALMSQSVDVEPALAGLSVSLGISQYRNTFVDEVPAATDTTPLLHHDKRKFSAVREETKSTSVRCLSSPRWKLFIIWSLAFFTACCVLAFNVVISDYLGKVVFGGDPEAELESEKRLLYEQGVRSASLSVLATNAAYFIFSLVHNKVLAALSLKAEYLLVNLSVAGLLLALRMTGNIVVAYVASAFVGLNRVVLYAVPFMLATNLCQQEDESSTTKGVGSTIALVSCALPSAYLVTNSIIGPLIDATGDPSTPLLICAVSSLLAAVTVLGYKS